MADKSLLIEEIKKLKLTFPDSKPDKLFEQACSNLKFKILKYFRENINMIFLYSCQILLNGKYMNIGKGKTPDDAYNNAIRSYFEKVEENYFIDEINENINNIDICDEFIEYCKTYFQKFTIKPSKFYRITFKKLKEELKSNSKFKSLTETYRDISKDKIICSIYIGEKLILSQGCGKTNEEALENTAKEFFISYSILADFNSKLEPAKPDFNLSDVLFKLKNHLDENQQSSTNYFGIIKTFVENLKFKFEMNFYNGISTVKINGIKVAEASDKDEYSCYISLCHNLLTKIDQAKPYVKPEKLKQECIFQSPINNTVKSANLTEFTLNNTTNLTKFQDIAREANREHQADEKLDWWNILNRCFTKRKIQIEPNYSNKDGNSLCSFLVNKSEIITESGQTKYNAREKAAKKFINNYL